MWVCAIPIHGTMDCFVVQLVVPFMLRVGVGPWGTQPPQLRCAKHVVNNNTVVVLLSAGSCLHLRFRGSLGGGGGEGQRLD